MIPTDDVLHGFTQAFDVGAIRGALETHMPSLGTVIACRIERFRYRKQKRAIFLYELETASGRGWICGHLYPGSKARRTFAGARGDKNVGFIPELGMLVERFPQDRKLGFIGGLMRGKGEALVNSLAACFGPSWQLSVTEIVPVRYRPGIAAVFRVEVAATSGTQTAVRRFYVKTYTERDVTGLFHDLSQNRDGRTYCLLRPMAVIPQANTIVWPEIHGWSLAEALLDGGNQACFARGAAALTEFHQSQQALRKVPPAEGVRRDCAKHAEFLSAIHPSLSGLTGELAQALPKAFAEHAFAPFHHDMKPEHVLIHDGQSTLIDVEDIALGDPALDIGNMLAWISAACWLNGASRESCRLAMTAFLDGIAPMPEHRLVAAYALGKMKTATFAVSHQVEDWARIASCEIDSAIHALHSASLGNAL